MRLSFSAATVVAALALSGCVATVPPVVAPVPTAPVVTTPPAPAVNASRSAAQRVVNVEMAKRLPGRNVAPYSSCVLDNATDAEIADLSTLTGQASAADAVANIVRRPGTTSCIGKIATA